MSWSFSFLLSFSLVRSDISSTAVYNSPATDPFAWRPTNAREPSDYNTDSEQAELARHESQNNARSCSARRQHVKLGRFAASSDADAGVKFGRDSSASFRDTLT